jgi:hypothetical protein
MEIKRLLVILGLSILFIVFFCDDIVEGSETGTIEPETGTIEPETIEPETIEPETETIEPETGENKMEVDDMIKLQMLQMEVLKDIVKNKK